MSFGNPEDVQEWGDTHLQVPDSLEAEAVLKAACRRLPDDAALVEFAAYDRTRRGAASAATPSFVALVTRSPRCRVTAVDLGEAVAEERDLFALFERLEPQVREFRIVGAQAPIIPDRGQPDHADDGETDGELLHAQFGNRELRGSRVSVSNPDERIRIHRLSIQRFWNPARSTQPREARRKLRL